MSTDRAEAALLHSAKADELFTRAWPHGVSRADVALFATLSSEDKYRVLVRLKAMLDADEGLAPRGELAARIGVDRTYFYKLHKRWQRELRLMTLVPYQSRPARRIARNHENELLLRTVRRILWHSAAGVRIGDVAKEAVKWEARRRARLARMKGDAGAVEPAELDRTRVAVAESAAVKVRRELASDVFWLKIHYGEAILADVTAISLALWSADDVKQQAVVALVIEASSGLILGHAMGAIEHARELQLQAIANAGGFIAEAGVDVCATRGDPPWISAVVASEGITRNSPSSPDPAEDQSMGTGDRVVGSIELRQGSARRFGMLILHHIGPMIGRIRIQPRSTYSSDPALNLANRRHSVMRTDDALAIWTYEVERHNSTIMERLKDLDRLCADGAMRLALAELQDMLAQRSS